MGIAAPAHRDMLQGCRASPTAYHVLFCGDVHTP